MMEFNGIPVIVSEFIGDTMHRKKIWKRSGNRLPKVRIRKCGRKPAMCEMNLPMLTDNFPPRRAIVVNPEALELLRQGCSL